MTGPQRRVRAEQGERRKRRAGEGRGGGGGGGRRGRAGGGPGERRRGEEGRGEGEGGRPGLTSRVQFLGETAFIPSGPSLPFAAYRPLRVTAKPLFRGGAVLERAER